MNKVKSWQTFLLATAILTCSFSKIFGLCHVTKPTAWITIPLKVSVSSDDGMTIDRVFFSGENFGWAMLQERSVIMTRDGGQSWNEIFCSHELRISSLFFLNGTDGFGVGTRGGKAIVLRTRDSGRTWNQLYGLKMGIVSAFTDIWFHDEMNGWATASVDLGRGFESLIFKTTNGGNFWIVQYRSGTVMATLRRLKFADIQHGWAVGDRIVLRTNDGGGHWVEQFSESKPAFIGGLDVLSKSEAWVAGGDGLLLHTVDGGSCWNQVRLPREASTQWLSSVLFDDRTHGWVAGQNGIILSTEDAGDTWQTENIGHSYFLRDLAANRSCIIAVGGEAVILRKTR